MTSDKKERRWGRIPIRFSDEPNEGDLGAMPLASPGDEGRLDNDKDSSGRREASGHIETAPAVESLKDDDEPYELIDADDLRDPIRDEASGPIFAELLASRAELKRLEAEVNDLRDKFARRQADFENFRKRVERERSEIHHRATADLVKKLLPVLDNLGRALDTEASIEANESDEFRHFLSGVDLIHKQLGGVLETLGVKPLPSVGEQFDPHVHEAVVTEETDDYEPDTVMQEIVRGYRLGDKLLRPALVKVAVKK